MHDESTARKWAEETFQWARLGDRRRTRRLIRLATSAAVSFAPTVSRAVATSAAREAAYRLLEQDAVPSQAVIDSVCEATAAQCAKLAHIYVAVDGSSLSFVDRVGARDVGRVGNWRSRGRGLQTMTAFAMTGKGVPIGILDLAAWARCKPSSRRRNRPARTTELSKALDAFDNVKRRIASFAPDCKAIVIGDRGFDAHQCLKLADDGHEFIVRASHDRRLEDGERGGRKYLRNTLSQSPTRATMIVHLPATPTRSARLARVRIKACAVRIHRRSGSNFLGFTDLNAVLVEEIGGRKQRICWRLLTTLPISTADEISEIVRAYGFRWRIEELHRLWKDGGCHVESNQLRKREAIIKWATILCAVAARALRLTKLYRVPDKRPALEEFTRFEIDATILLGEQHNAKERLNCDLGDVPAVDEVIRAIAFIGGWSGQYTGRPPGPLVIGRGLDRVLTTASALEAMERRRTGARKR